MGACIQCSVKTCKTAYHVTCAFKHGLEMRAIIDEENSSDDDNTVKLRVRYILIYHLPPIKKLKNRTLIKIYCFESQSYCQKHSSNKKETVTFGSDEEVKKKQRKDLTIEEKTHARAVK